ncbi:IFT57 family protein [Megaselia abdita]
MQQEFQQALDKEQQNVLPLTSFQSDDLIEKLKILNYEKQLLKEMRMKPLSKFYFVRSTNPGEQFFMFTSICAWLIRKLGKDFDQPQEYDDPTVVIGNIIKCLDDMDIPTEFPPNKLIQGAGPICLFVLDCLASQVLKVSKLTLHRPQIKQEEDAAPDYMEDNAEIILEKVEEEQMMMSDEDSDDNIGSSLRNLNWMASRNLKSSYGRGNYDNNEQLNESDSWRLELERVLPQLKVVVKADVRDWRAHLKQMEVYKENIQQASDDAQTQLKKLQSELGFAMDKVESREKHLNNELKNLIKQFKDISIELSTIQAGIKETEYDTDQITRELMEIVSDIETIKSKMEQRGQSMSDGSPVINIKKAIVKLKEDISHLNLEMGLLNYSLDQDYLRQASIYAEIESNG